MSDDLLAKEETISYQRLYRLWEENNWSATNIDFSLDKEHWQVKLDETQRDAALWTYAMFLVGEEAVARTLTPVMDAAPSFEQTTFLATQIVDEARHHVFFDRFMREVAAEGRDMETTYEAMQRHLTWGFQEVFAELDRLTDALHRKPKDRALLAQVIALYHFVIEGLLAIPGQHFIKRYVQKFDILPGFGHGIAMVAKDESRHVAFGVKFLGDLVRADPECRDAAIELWDRVLPWSIGVYVPPDPADHSYVECFGYTMNEIYAFGLRSFETKLRRIGIDPKEIRMLGFQDHEASYEERARQSWVLIIDGVLGNDSRDPQVSREGFEILFSGLARATDVEAARSLGGAIEWDFTDAEPWHLVVTNGHIEAKLGRAGDAALRLEATSSDWAKIAVGRVDPRMALLKRRLRVQGSLAAKARLPKLFAY